MARENTAWLSQLRGDTSDQHSALSDLRLVLVRNLRQALSKYGPADDAFVEDMVQDSLLRILDKLDQFAGRSQFLTWARSISVRVAMSELRRRRWRDVSLNDVIASTGFVSEAAADDSTSLETAQERDAIVKKLYEVIQSELTDRQRAALLAELRGMPQDEIARHLGSNRNAVYKLSHDARRRLKRCLEAAGYEAADVLAAISQ